MITLTIPEWFLWVIVVIGVLSLANACLAIYIYYLRNEIVKKQERLASLPKHEDVPVDEGLIEGAEAAELPVTVSADAEEVCSCVQVFPDTTERMAKLFAFLDSNTYGYDKYVHVGNGNAQEFPYTININSQDTHACIQVYPIGDKRLKDLLVFLGDYTGGSEYRYTKLLFVGTGR